MSAMKASSMVGSGWSSVTTRAFSSSGEPSAIERPEVQAGIAFASAFLIARILKRLVD